LLAWLHAVLLERLRYTPIGYTKTYEFNEADFRCALDLVDEFVDNVAGDRSNVDPEKIPWDGIRVILAQNLYGGKIDNEYDGKILTSLVDHLFTENSFKADYKLFIPSDSAEAPMLVPEAIRYQQYVDWVDNLPVIESPSWSGLPNSVEKVMKESNTEKMLFELWNIQDAGEEEITVIEIPPELLPQQESERGGRGMNRGGRGPQD